MTVATPPTFVSLALCPQIVRAVAEKNYSAPTPIQSAVIPGVLSGRDVWACAHTGSGKTAAFALPILQRHSEAGRETPRRVRSLILVPTRELAAQIGASFEAYARYLPDPVKVAVVFGGVSINPQMMALRGGADIVVATPGRLLDLLEHNALSLRSVATVVLDEADRLLDLGFADELSRVLMSLPERRQNLLFSATFPPEVNALAAILLRDPLRVDVPSTPETVPDITQRSIHVDAPRRTQLLLRLLREHGWSRVLVFVATKYSTEHVADKLHRAGINAEAFHGELSQGARTQVLADFKAERLQVLVATDVAARGIDITHLPAVVNYDLPRSTDDYVHRIGRTGRAGQSGVAVSFVSASTESHFRLIEKRHRMTLAREIVPGFEPVETAAPVAPVPGASTGGIKGKRKSKKDKLRERGLK
ncbi:DEAD/DEAH box helicase [Peristeroidobacter soli]|jgi:superfamily II DNA/RNA helicase|uniref:DEAD/DEAH box helicase n=1 Tax=Peristeroidobacter soli TaxID=2497877 RepID=UPI00101D02B6|nr:DEAD/DEAH box helicase [Peristeroidobacter soli]